MIELFAGSWDIVGHGEIAVALVWCVIPVKRDATVKWGIPVGAGGFAVVDEDIVKVVGIGFVVVLGEEVVDDETERKGFGGVFPESGCMARGVASVFAENLLELFVG